MVAVVGKSVPTTQKEANSSMTSQKTLSYISTIFGFNWICLLLQFSVFFLAVILRIWFLLQQSKSKMKKRKRRNVGKVREGKEGKEEREEGGLEKVAREKKKKLKVKKEIVFVL